MVARVTGQPPGRAGRVWLDRRIAMASRGAGLLEQKLRILVGLEQRYSLMHDRTLQAKLVVFYLVNNRRTAFSQYSGNNPGA